MNLDPNNRARRRSRLGRGRVVDEPPRPTPVVPTAVKSTAMYPKASKDMDAKKRLFLRSPLTDISISGTVRAMESAGSSLLDSYSQNDTLNPMDLTGIHQFTSPSPNKSECSTKYSYLDNISGKLEKPKSPGPSEYSRLMFEELNKVKKPVDPGESIHMNRWLDEQVNSYRKLALENTHTTTASDLPIEEPSTLLRHINPVFKKTEKPSGSECNPQLGYINGKTKPDSKSTAPHTSITTVEPSTTAFLSESQGILFEFKKPEDLSARLSLMQLRSNNSNSLPFVGSERYNSTLTKELLSLERSSVVLEQSPSDLNTTDSFELAEQTIMEQNETVTEDVATTTANITKIIATKGGNLLQSISEEQSDSDSDEEELQEWLEEINKVMKQMTALKSKVLRHLARKKRKANTKINNKENISKNVESKWMSSLKSENPSLLKTPNPGRNSKLETSIMDQSSIWTPRSLSTVVRGQLDDLFE